MKRDLHFYKKAFVILLCLIICGTSAFSLSKTDSLSHILKSTINDTLRINVLLELSLELSGDNNEMAKKYSTEALVIARRLNNPVKVAKSYLYIGKNFFNQNDFKNALDNYFKSLKIEEQLKRYAEMAIVYEYIGTVYLYQNSFDVSLKYYIKSLDINTSQKNDKRVAKNYQEVATVYLHQGMFDKAISYCKLSIKMADKAGDIEQKSFTMYSLALCYYYQDDKKTALEYFKKSYEIHVLMKDKPYIASGLVAIGDTYLYLRDFKNAVKYNKEAYKIASEIGHTSVQKLSVENIANGFDSLKMYDSALYYHREFSRIKDSIYFQDSQDLTNQYDKKYEADKAAEAKAEAERKAKEREEYIATLQYFGIFFGILVLILGIYFSGRLILNRRIAEGLIFFSMILFIEFVLVLLDDKLRFLSQGMPIFRLGANACLALLMLPIHQYLERMLTRRMYQTRVKNAVEGGLIDDIKEEEPQVSDKLKQNNTQSNNQ